MGSSDLIAIISTFIATGGFLISLDARRIVALDKRVAHVREAISDVFSNSCRCLISSGDDARNAYLNASLAYTTLNARCRDHIELDSLFSQKTVKPALTEFFSASINEDLVALTFDSDDANAAMERLESTRRNLILKIETAGAELNRPILMPKRISLFRGRNRN